MRLRVLLVLLALVLVAPACTGGSSEAPAALEQESSTPIAGDGATSKTVRALLDAFNPVNSLLLSFGATESADTSQDLDPSFMRALLDIEDMPPQFQPFDEAAYSNTEPGVGTLEFAARVFVTGNLDENDLGTVVASTAIGLPPRAVYELTELTTPQEAMDRTAREAEEAFRSGGGEDLGTFQVLDGADLGDGGYGTRMEVDISLFIEEFLMSQDVDVATLETIPFSAGLGIEAYFFYVDDQMLVASVYWPLDQQPAADARELAELMAGRAG